MAGQSWLVDSQRIATKIKCASETCDPRKLKWKSNPTKACPRCNHVIDNSDVTHEWPGLPRGVKFDPTDQEIIWHLISKVGVGDAKPHPFIDEFIPTVAEDDGICYTHPQNLPGVKQDGSVCHFFHRSIKAYNTGTRKRRKIHGDDSGDVRWHKTGKTKPIILDGIHTGCKKIMVLYMSTVKGGKPEKTNWVMHQYHLGTGEDEKDGEFVISKILYQQQSKQGDKIEQEPPDVIDPMIAKVDPITPPKSVTPEPPCTENWFNINRGPESDFVCRDPSQHAETEFFNDDVQPECEKPDDQYEDNMEDHDNHLVDGTENQAEEDPKWWEGESQFLLDSQQLVEGLSLCDELLQSQSPNRYDNGEERKSKPRLSDYAHIGAEHLKKDLEECQNLNLIDSSNIYLDTPPDFRLSQFEFGSQESFSSLLGTKAAD